MTYILTITARVDHADPEDDFALALEQVTSKVIAGFLTNGFDISDDTYYSFKIEEES